MLSFRSLNAISGSTIQNSAKCLEVFEFSALNVGPKVYTFPSPIAILSASNCPETVRLVSLPKKSLEKSIFFLLSISALLMSRVVTLNISPAPSASLPVIIGVFT